MSVPRCLAALALLAVGAHAAAETFTLDPREMRTVELSANTALDEWVRRNGIEDFEVLAIPGGGAILRFPMEEGVWRARRQAMCTEKGVLACSTDFCQVAEVNARVLSSAGLAQSGSQVLLLPKAPDISVLFGEQAPGAERCTRTEGSAAKPVFKSAGADGSFALPSAEDPSLDSGCWEIVVANGCEARTRPLSDFTPEHEPRKLLAVVPLNERQQGGVDTQLLQRVTDGGAFKVLEVTPLESIGKALIQLEIAAETLDAASALSQLQAQSGIEAAQYEYRYRTSAEAPVSAPTARNDPFAWMNYGARLTGADRLYPALTGAGVNVVVIDSGIDANHPELKGRIGEQLDFTGFGLSADRHGTAIAGIIGAAVDNEIGAYGIAPQANIVSLKACQPTQQNSADSRCWSSTLAKALNAALAREARIINMSLGGPKDPLIEQLVAAALAKGRIVVAAGGNGGPDAPPSFPAALLGVIAVTAIDAREKLYAGATRGDFIDLAAPGVEIPVAVPGATYPGQLSGTSMAAAHVSAIVALILSKTPALAADTLRSSLETTAADLGPPAMDKQFGHGRINGCAAAQATTGSTELCQQAGTGGPKQ